MKNIKELTRPKFRKFLEENQDEIFSSNSSTQCPVARYMEVSPRELILSTSINQWNSEWTEFEPVNPIPKWTTNFIGRVDSRGRSISGCQALEILNTL